MLRRNPRSFSQGLKLRRIRRKCSQEEVEMEEEPVEPP
jgi:hypothetical protein